MWGTFDGGGGRERVQLNLLRLDKGGEHFEVPIRPDRAIAYKEGKDVAVSEILESENIFSDCQRGELASEKHMETVFGTKDPIEVAKIMLEEGNIQLNSAERDKVREQKRNKIVATIARDAIDPKTKLPHPVERIELAMKEARITIDEFRTAENQIEDIISKLRPIIPISFEKRVLKIRIPGASAGKAQHAAREFGTIKHETWGDDGSWLISVELSGGLVDKYVQKLNNVTHGSCEVKEIK
ncbi:MAG: ribosome assembly factor SBDS [Nanoarchaeota archaeon]|nr:ribosome assembly factor SBDS [Nanoarchaeota archaeon]